MFGPRIDLFKVFGFKIRLDWTWFIIALLVTWSLAAGYFPENYESLQTATYWIMGAVGAIGLFASIVLHEIGHAAVARYHGMNIRGITLFVFGGVAEMSDEPPTPRAEFQVAAAGPLVSVLLAAALYLLTAALQAVQLGGPAVGVTAWLATVNLVVVVFNLVPGFPLDGGRILRSALWAWKENLRWATRVTARIGSAFGVFLIVWGVLQFISGYAIGGMWLAVVGLFLRGAAQSSYQQLLVRQVLEGEPVSRFMHAEPHTVPPSITLRELVDDHVYRHHFKLFPVEEDGRLLGCVTTRQIKEVPREEWDTKHVADVLQECSGENTIEAGADAMEALSRFSRTGNSRMLVVADGKLQGILSLKDLMGFLSLKLELDDNS